MIPIPQTVATIGARSEEANYGGEPELRHRANVSPYAAGQFEVTNAEFAVFLNDQPGKAEARAGFNAAVGSELHKTPGGWRVSPDGADLPVVGVSWQLAREYARWLSEKTKRDYRLSTSAEWEVAARGGMETAWWWGNAVEGIGASETHAGKPRPAVGLTPNPWGLYGTEGNVWQWTEDCFHRDAAELAALKDPEFSDAGCALPEIRGGSFKEGVSFSRSAYRSNLPAGSVLDNVGFRVIRVAEPAPAGEGLSVEYESGGPAEVWAVAAENSEAPEFEGVTMGGQLPRLKQGIHLLLADTASGLVLFDGALPGAGPIRVKKVVRFTAKIAGAAAGSVVHGKVGTGERMAPFDRWLRESGATSARDERAKNSFGVPLPLSPSHWQKARIAGRDFDSGWVFAEAPQAVIFDSAGNALVRDILLPAGLGEHENFDAGTLTLEPMRELNVSVKVPEADLDLPLTLGVHDVTLGDSPAEEVGRYLSALDQIDERLFGLLVLDHGLSLAPNGDAHLSYLPRYAAMTLLVHDPRSDRAAEKTVQLSSETAAQLVLTERGSGAPTGAFSGSVHLSGTATAVAGATVVVSQYPNRHETVTDAEGRFSVEGVSTSTPVDVAVTVPEAAAKDIFVRSEVFRKLDAAKPAELAIPGIDRRSEMEATRTAGSWPAKPSPPAAKGAPGQLGDPDCANLVDGQYGLYTSWLAAKDQTQTDAFSVLHVLKNQASISTCSTGDWNFLYADNVVAAYIGSGIINEFDKAQYPQLACRNLPACPTACYNKLFTMNPLQTQVTRLLTFKTEAGFGIGGINVDISPIAELISLDPTAVVADGQGRIKLCNVDTNPIHVFAGDASGRVVYDCSINLLEFACDAYVPNRITNTPEACAKTLIPPSCAAK
jgi:formylglycine-generating enzyme required for sulfatase activity